MDGRAPDTHSVAIEPSHPDEWHVKHEIDVVAVASVLTSIAIAYLLYRLGRKGTSTEKDKALLLDHVKGLRKELDAAHAQLKPIYSKPIGYEDHLFVSSRVDDISDHLEAMMIGTAQSKLKPGADWLESLRTAVADYRRHVTSVSVSQELDEKFVSAERDLYNLASTSAEKLQYLIHRL